MRKRERVALKRDRIEEALVEANVVMVYGMDLNPNSPAQIADFKDLCRAGFEMADSAKETTDTEDAETRAERAQNQRAQDAQYEAFKTVFSVKAERYREKYIECPVI